MLIIESKGLIFRTKLFLFFIAKAMGIKKAEVLEFNALPVDIKICF